MICGGREITGSGFGILFPTFSSPNSGPGIHSQVPKLLLTLDNPGHSLFSTLECRPLGIPGGKRRHGAGMCFPGGKDGPAPPAAGTGDNGLPGGATSCPPPSIHPSIHPHPSCPSRLDLPPAGARPSGKSWEIAALEFFRTSPLGARPPRPFSGGATSRVTPWGTARCHHVPSPAVPHPALPSRCHHILLQQCHTLGHCQVPPHPSPAVPHPALPPRCHHVPSPGSHPGALPGATTSLLSGVTSRATPWGTARCHHILLQQCHIQRCLPGATTSLHQGHIQGHCQVPPRPCPAVSHPGAHPGELPGAILSFSSSVTSSAASQDTARCHHVLAQQCHIQRCLPDATTSLLQGHIQGHCQVPPRPSPAVPHPGPHPGALPGATTSFPRVLGTLWCLGCSPRFRQG
ncbi:uncharacterized protein [Aphelocoma coerulescens]|uniref:uncharacterized protein isoform X2 n=1 Tax=Aphelocoma coerulescens TaxID=39617 RepID=UPI00360454D1